MESGQRVPWPLFVDRAQRPIYRICRHAECALRPSHAPHFRDPPPRPGLQGVGTISPCSAPNSHRRNVLCKAFELRIQRHLRFLTELGDAQDRVSSACYSLPCRPGRLRLVCRCSVGFSCSSLNIVLQFRADQVSQADRTVCVGSRLPRGWRRRTSTVVFGGPAFASRKGASGKGGPAAPLPAGVISAMMLGLCWALAAERAVLPG
jgi:hypothetical protein